MNRIICIGNRLLNSDHNGMVVYDRLMQRKLPENITVIEGGIAGINLLPLLEDGGRIVFVDTVSGFTEKGQFIVLDQQQIISDADNAGYGHDAGIPYLLAILPQVCQGEIPEKITLIGLEGECSDAVIEQAATVSIRLASSDPLPANAE